MSARGQNVNGVRKFDELDKEEENEDQQFIDDQK